MSFLAHHVAEFARTFLEGDREHFQVLAADGLVQFAEQERKLLPARAAH